MTREEKKIRQFTPGCLVGYYDERMLEDSYRYFGMVLSNSDGYIKIKWWWSSHMGPTSVIEYVNCQDGIASLNDIQVLQ